MDLLRIDSNTFMPDLYIEGGEKGYDSLIWTERYLEAGEFELRTPVILPTKRNLPEGSLVSHRETQEVMMVDSHEITRDEDGVDVLVVKGRSLEAFSEHRALEGPWPKKKYLMARNYTGPEAASVILWNAYVNPSENDVTRIGEDLRDSLDTIPNTVVTDSTTMIGTSSRRWLTGGQIYTQLLDVLRAGRMGIRTIRPPSSTAKVVSVTTGDKGIISYATRPITQSLRFDIYNGVNRSRQQTAVDPVIFHHGRDYMTDQSYLFSSASYDTMVMVVSSFGTRKYYRSRASDSTLSGLNRRVLWVDGGEAKLEDLPDAPDDGATDAQVAAYKAKLAAVKAKNAQTKLDYLDDLVDKANSELAKHDRTRVFDCKIATNSPYNYNEHYSLGDLVTLIGDYDFDETMRVVEYVRTDDANGDVGYPALAVAT